MMAYESLEPALTVRADCAIPPPRSDPTPLRAYGRLRRRFACLVPHARELQPLEGAAILRDTAAAV